ncbi:Spermidine/putrescine ABC transporter ATPase subunit [Pseudomonas coronafaciens pv. oryzae]|nr:Spermidine/putrescine ABC transporter ATPase subunit [Pseudomonas coronafaciens pv. oryzae]
MVTRQGSRHRVPGRPFGFYVELPGGKLVQSFVANAERQGARPTWGDEVYVWWEDDSGVVLRS